MGAVRIGAPAGEVLRLVGKPFGQVIRDQDVVYLFRDGLQVTVRANRVLRIAARGPSCATRRGVGIGDVEGRVRAAYERSVGSLRSIIGDLVRLLFPFEGVGFVLVQNRVTQIEVFRAEAPPGAARTVAPTPTAVQGFEIVSVSTRLEGRIFVVRGVVRAQGPPTAVFAEVALLGPDGRVVAEDTTPLSPNPVGGGRTAAFEERFAAGDIVARVAVTIRPMNRPTAILARATHDVTDVAQFAALVDRLIDVVVLGAGPEQAGGTVAAVTNRSPLQVTGLVIALSMRTSCRNLTASGEVRRLFDQREGTIRVAVLPPQGRVEVPIDLESRGPCLGIADEWSVTWRVVSASVEAPPR